MTDWAAACVTATRRALAELAAPDAATAMAAYMKGVAPFLGVAAPARRAAQRQAWSTLGDPATADLAGAAEGLWAEPERELQYAACDLIARHVRAVDAGFLVDPVERLLVTRPWWDTVDALGSAAVRPLVARHAGLVDVVERWSESGDRWLVRSAILHQLGRRDLDEERLFRLCARHGGDREFFVAKAVGWALRDHARRSPDAVRAFVAGTPLQPLSVREALKHLR